MHVHCQLRRGAFLGGCLLTRLACSETNGGPWREWQVRSLELRRQSKRFNCLSAREHADGKSQELRLVASAAHKTPFLFFFGHRISMADLASAGTFLQCRGPIVRASCTVFLLEGRSIFHMTRTAGQLLPISGPMEVCRSLAPEPRSLHSATKNKAGLCC